ncbi:MAG: pyridoxal phosphate-dependent aminotransferase [Crocinitomicaceae bacterium]|nr:pyridoxal phosphate-dependent aminotransferase [Crocinitomicaceae bacterium]MBK8925497.1 pyridoxal phosphate-dependent aminotransferase [Crocinitomicaceae bacterium]
MKKGINKNTNAFREVPYMGVIWVVAEAMKRGFYNGNPEWSNLGQGQPEIGEMEGAPKRITSFSIEPGDQAYGPLSGSQGLREMIADHYNRLYRKKNKSKYTADNVSVCMGGRLALTRIFAALGKVKLGYKNPEYTAYQDTMAYHQSKITCVEIPVTEKNGFNIPANKLSSVITKNKLGALLISNPCNPTGYVIQGKELATWVKTARQKNCALILDEFYSHFIYEGKNAAKAGISGAEFIDDVDKDPVLLIDGLTKSFRYPGWRVGWIVGPKNIIENINRAASAVDGGPSQPMTRATMKVLEKNYADQETKAVRNMFSRKKNFMVESLTKAGINILPSNGTFYLWGDISKLPTPINKAERFFFEALNHKVMTVPGYFFDVQPKPVKKQNFQQWIRFSFGPDEKNMKAGLTRLNEMIDSFRKKSKKK